VDVFLGPDPKSDLVYIVDQMDPRTGRFDEHKVMMGWYCEADAREGYMSNYDKNWKGFGGIYALTFPQFKKWLDKGDQKKPVGDQVKFYQRL
jgi:hypothetical protein